MMNWYLITTLSLPALVMAILSLRGYTQNIELYLWMLLGLFTMLVVIKNMDQHLFIHLLLIGFFWGVLNGLVQSFFYDLYMAHNSQAASSFSRLPQSFNPRLVILMIGPATGLATGLTLGVISLFMRKLLSLF